MLDIQAVQKGTPLLIQSDDWMMLSDGANYMRFWGICKVVEAKDIFGFKPSGDTNWYLQIGSNEGSLIIAGCRIHYAQVCKEIPTGKEIAIIN